MYVPLHVHYENGTLGNSILNIDDMVGYLVQVIRLEDTTVIEIKLVGETSVLDEYRKIQIIGFHEFPKSRNNIRSHKFLDILSAVRNVHAKIIKNFFRDFHHLTDRNSYIFTVPTRLNLRIPIRKVIRIPQSTFDKFPMAFLHLLFCY